MRFGVCKSLENAQLVKDNGYDYIEANLQSIAKMSEEEFEKQLEFLKQADIPCESSNCFFPSSLLLVGDDVDYEKIAQYAECALSRAAKLGVKVSVMGSGKTRNVPDGYDRQKATDQFKRVVTLCSDIARKYGIKIALEPLNHGETNMLNTVAQAYQFCRELADDNVGIVADFYHIFMVNEPVEDVVTAKDYIFHLHIARPNEDRLAPSVADADTLKIWADAVKAAGYNGRLSLECTSKADFVGALQSMAQVKYIFS